MRNDYEIRGDTTAIILNTRKYGQMETLIATSDLDRADEFPNTWFAKWKPNSQSFYVEGHLPRGGGSKKTALLHRWILNVTDPKIQVDHVMHDTLDNCRWALNSVTNAENQQNRRRGKNNASGVIGVRWCVRGCKWQARIAVNNHLRHLGYFTDIEDAIAARKSAEIEYHTYKQEIS